MGQKDGKKFQELGEVGRGMQRCRKGLWPLREWGWVRAGLGGG
jgi:hypothetical protein